MFIILKKRFDTDEILNVFYGQDETLVRKWIKNYIEEEIESLNLSPVSEGIKNVTYTIDDSEKNIKLIKKYKKVNKGYIYNSSEKLDEVMYTIITMEYSGNTEFYGLNANEPWNNINNEINNRVLKQLDKDSLYQVLLTLQTKINTKESWNKIEYTNLISETIKSFKKELYISVAKKLKRFGRKQSLYKYNTSIHTQNMVPENFNEGRFSCKLEVQKPKQE